jgi:DNA-binding response OmpR family regulator
VNNRVSRPTVLIVEDEPLIAVCLQELLEDTGLRVLVAGCVQRGMSFVRDPAVRAAIVDWALGSENAGEVCRALSERGIPFCFLTGGLVIPPEWDHVPLLVKPVGSGPLLRVVQQMLRKPNCPPTAARVECRSAAMPRA